MFWKMASVSIFYICGMSLFSDSIIFNGFHSRASQVIMLWCLVSTAIVWSSADNPAFSGISNDTFFNRIVIDPKHGRIYAAATNAIYQLTSELDLEEVFYTGPVEDNVQCFTSNCQGYALSVTPNVNKLLIIDPEFQMLIACGSIYQGACRRHKLENISQAEDLVPVPVAANDGTTSTYAFIGPARYPGSPARVLYVATGNSRKGPYRDMVPSVCSRILDPQRLFAVVDRSFSSIARVDISSHVRDYFIINYVYGFHLSDFVYFAMVQRRSHLRALEEWGYLTRMSRICVSDPGYNTYTEVTLQCIGQDGTDYNLLQDASVVHVAADLAANLRISVGTPVLVGVFTTSRGHSSIPDRHSAVCVYSMPEIDRVFNENIHLCYNGSMINRNMDYIAGTLATCPQAGKGGNILSFCGETLKINGTVPIVSSPVVVYSNVTFTSVATTVYGPHTLAFIGSDNGFLKEVVLVSSTYAQEFDDVAVDTGNSILPGILLDASQQFLYVATHKKISKISVQRCHQYETCDSCLQMRNPYCGWCTLEKWCTVQSACHNSTFGNRKSSHWLSPITQQCIGFQSVSPQSLPITSFSQVELVINQLPQLPHNTHYMCVFGNSKPSQAQITNNGLMCTTPDIAFRPKVPVGKDHIVVDLGVRSSEINTDFLKKPFIFYKCGVHNTCMSCVTSAWPCNWCLHDNLCTHNSSVCTHSVITGENNPHRSLVKGRDHCPSFILQEEILLPHGIPKELIVEVKNLPRAVDDFWCVIEIEGVKQHVIASIKNSRIVCSKAIYTYQKEVGELQAFLTVISHGDTFIGKTNVTLYKCPLLGTHSSRADCSLCLSQHERYQCVWCSHSCNYRESCNRVPDSICPPPHIDWVHPLSGPVEGGTLVTIEGSNLGINMEEVEDRILIGGISCIPVSYNISVRIICRTGAADGPMEGDIIVGNVAGFSKAQEKYLYQVVELDDVQPSIGPRSGGTRLYLSGSNLNVGTNVEVFLDNIPCIVDRTLSSSSQISCITSESPLTTYNVSELILQIDAANVTFPDPFLFTDDPTILRISPLKSYVSGGRSITVAGTYLNSIQQPRMAVFHNHTFLNESICDVISSSTMICPSPSVASIVFNLSTFENSNENKWTFSIGFLMDNVKQVKNLQENFPTLHSDLAYVNDPQVVPFENIKQYKGEPLVIEGRNFLLAGGECEVSVFIGNELCNLTSLTTTQLVCLPPEMIPEGMDSTGRRTENGLPLITMHIGSALQYRIGYLQYELDQLPTFPPEAIGGIAAGASLVFIVSLIIVAVLRHKSYQAEREYKRIQLQMDSLENSVRCECKQAFAELQTDMTDLTNDLEVTGIPTVDHRTYVLKVFFPGIVDHPLIHTPKRNNRKYYSNYEAAMGHFEHLLNNKGFLLTFIDTLEAQKSFTIRDRVNVASLLMVILIEKMEYATEVLKTLLWRLIEKTVGTKHPQLMLRRTESVVEKMLTNWMALSMYLYLKENAGNPIFLLYRAIKHQVQKGPVDAITYNARYSLSEERLLREQIDYSPVTLQVIQEEFDEKVICRVLDCDTITQVKNKILDFVYKNIPFSLRPSVNEIDIVWRPFHGGRLILADEDHTTKTINGWRQLNTLKHYGIKESAVINLVIKQNTPLESNYTEQNTSLSLSSSMFPLDSCDMGISYWHLIKSDDDDLWGQYSHKAIPEVYLTRLLSTKGIIQKFVDDCLSTIVTVNDALPPAVKWLFDLLDTAAQRYLITDPEVIHAWKSNSLPLRFWVHFIKNPDCILDIEKTPAIDSCLSIVAQTLMDACSVCEHRLGKDSPSTKLLFARDMPRYRKMVSNFYRDIATLPPVSDQEMGMTMQALSLSHRGEFDSTSALKELYVYIVKFNEQILESLESDPYCQKLNLAQKLESVAYTLEGEEIGLS